MESERDHTRLTAFRVPRRMWGVYDAVTRRLGTNRSARLLDHIRADIRQHGTPEEVAELDAAERELSERRARKGGRPPRAS
ncbi:hypothetical protein ABT158_05865 [Nonomuraea sp. NPDC001636]|uniref:hypothetical protein n=1 Tax=Nonomuraea sp. NPDC001636 TaxID=3154391 RepID=UPI00331B7C38